MFERTNWRWVKDWTGRIGAAGFLLLTFAFLAGGNVIRPGGVMDALPSIMLRAAFFTLPLGFVVLIALALYSHRQGGEHDS